MMFDSIFWRGSAAWIGLAVALLIGCNNRVGIESKLEEASSDWNEQRPRKFVNDPNAIAYVYDGYRIQRVCDKMDGLRLTFRGGMSKGAVAYNSKISAIISESGLPVWLRNRIVDDTHLVDAYEIPQVYETKELPYDAGDLSVSQSTLAGHVVIGTRNGAWTIEESVNKLVIWHSNGDRDLTYLRIGKTLFVLTEDSTVIALVSPAFNDAPNVSLLSDWVTEVAWR